MKKLTTLIAVTLALSGIAKAETFVVPPYPATPAWKQITDKSSAQMTLKEWIPADQSENDVRDILTEQIFPAQKGADPSEFTKGFLKRVGGQCRDASVNGPKAGTENSFAVAYAQAYCVGVGRRDVDIFFKAIAGKDALYVVQREFRRAATPGAVAGMRKFSKDEGDAAKAALEAQNAANTYLVSQVKLCPGDVKTCTPEPAAQTLAQSAAGPDDVSAKVGFEAGKSTQDDVEKKFGQSSMPTKGPNGQHTAMYTFKNGIIVVFLFGKDDVLIRTIAYAQK